MTVTLIVGLSKPEGIYVSTDYRVTDLKSRAVLDDASVKFLRIRYPPHEGGPTALLAYTGLARLRDTTSMGVWIRETLRGEMNEGFDASMAHLRERLDRDVGPIRVGLIINMIVIQGEQRYLGGFSNIRVDADNQTHVFEPAFEYMLKEQDRSFYFANGSGAYVVGGDDEALLKSQLRVKPRKPLDHMKLLAAINRRVAARDKRVSPFCHVGFVNADEKTAPQGRAFVEKDEEVPFDIPALLFGVDLSILGRRFDEAVKAAGGPGNPFEVPPTPDEELKRRP